MCDCTASQGVRRSAPIIGDPNAIGSFPWVKGLDELESIIYCQATLPYEEEWVMTATAETITVEGMEIRFLVEGKDSAGMLAVFEFGVPAGVKIAVAHSHDGYEETIYGLEGVLTWTVEGE